MNELRRRGSSSGAPSEQRGPAEPAEEPSSYQERLAEEQRIHRSKVDIDGELPEIFHYVSNKYWKPKFEALGIRGIVEFYSDRIHQAWVPGRRPLQVCSIGAGNCDVETDIARDLCSRGVEFIFTCIDLSEEALQRGEQRVREQGLGDRFSFVSMDVNRGELEPGSLDFVLANQSLHHLQELEVVLDGIGRALRGGGAFLTMDMIGRNGHMRWPESLEVVQKIWASLPAKYKVNHQLNRFEEVYENWDCSDESFEGVRSQDILPLLIQRFDFELFLSFGNVVDVFIDRGFGPNYDPDSYQDRAIIDLIAILDECLIESGVVTPCHLVAAMQPRGANPGGRAGLRSLEGLTPERCVRPPLEDDPPPGPVPARG